MREARFIKKNVDKWDHYQKSKTKDPDEIANRFVNLLDDLSYARTFYPHSNVTNWINGIAAGIYQSIYQNRKRSLKDVVRFWKYELPLLFYKYRKVLYFSLVVFLVCVGMSVLSCMADPSYARNYFDHKVQPGYYDHTIELIQKGDPFGVYKDDNPFSMFVRIAYNNIRVAFTTVLFGITFGIGTLMLMYSNGFMLGCFQYIFFSQGLGWQSVLVIWIHGTIEISSIVIAGCAGFVLGKSLLFPGTFTRKQSFIVAAKDAMKMCIALIPFFFVASFFESYVTHLMSVTFEKNTTEIGLPVPVSLMILAGSAFLMTWYFVLYPLALRRRGFDMVEGVVTLNGKNYAKERD